MKHLWVTVSVIVLAFTAALANEPSRPAPDFWYVVPAGDPGARPGDRVRGIVVPATVAPSVRASASGSVISWSRPDGTRQSFVVQGVPLLSFERGPLDGTTYIPFGRARRLEYAPDACCSCASWENSEESAEALSCVVGCHGCGCEGCICSPTYPCPGGPEAGIKLVAHNDPGSSMTIGPRGGRRSVGFERRGRPAARFDGRRLEPGVDAQGVTTIADPDTITLFGPVAAWSSIWNATARYAWSSPDASVILEQPAAMPAPLFHDGTIELDTRGRILEPRSERCKVCGTHPDSVADLEIYDCVPGDSICYRCIGWEC